MNLILRGIGAFATLMVLWVLLSGKFDAMHLGFGVLTAVALMWYYRPRGHGEDLPVLGLMVFIPWQLWQIFLSNLRVAKLILAQEMPIAPAMIHMKPGVEGDTALTTLGCSITLTPGTLTLEVDEDHILVHALDRASREDVEAGVIAKKVDWVFGRDKV